MAEIDAMLKQLLQRLDVAEGPLDERPLECGAYPFAYEGVDGRLYCDGRYHLRAIADRQTEGAGACPLRVAREVRARLEAERERLAPALERMRRESGSDGWDGYDTSDPSARLLFDTLRRFSQERPPRRGLYLRGGMGQGKTRLMIAAHLDLLAAGVDSRFARMSEARRVFEKTGSDDHGERIKAFAWVDNLRRADVVFFDEVGMAGDQRFIGDFREALYELLETTRAVWVVSTNLSTAELERNPDVGPQTLSRLVRGAEVLQLTHRDYRMATLTLVSPGGAR